MTQLQRCVHRALGSRSCFLFAIAFVGCTVPSARNVSPGARNAAVSPAVEPWSAPPLERALSVRDGRTGETIGLDELYDRLAKADVVFLGETHTDETTHRVELATYEALLARRKGRVVLAMEMFERDEQPALDAYLAGSIDEPTFLSKTRPWSNYRTAYRPLIERAKASKSPVVASNFPTPLRRRMGTDGTKVLADLPETERRQAPVELMPETPAYWRRVDNAVRGHIGMMGPRPAADDPRLDDTQSLWDNSMGESCARALDEHPGSMVLHVNGGFHSEYWDGTARQLALRKPNAKILTVAVDPSSNPAVEELSGLPRADFVVFAEARAKDVDDGVHAVVVPRELKYRLYLPPHITESQRVPLLIWLGDDGATASDDLSEWRTRLGEQCAIVAIEAPYRELQDDLVEGGRWYWPDSFSEDVGALLEGVERSWAFVLRHHPVDPARVCIAGEGTGATVTAAIALLEQRMDITAIALAPRRFAKIKDFPLPLPELAGGEPPPRKSLRILASTGDDSWWSGEIDEYNHVGFQSQLSAATQDPWLADLERENAVRTALALEPRTVPPNATRRYIVADGPRARAFGRRLALQQLRTHGEIVALLRTVPPATAATEANAATELPTAIHARDFQSGLALPRCPGAFGGTTIIALPADLPTDEVDAWLALENNDPLAKQSRFHRLRIATTTGEHALPTVLAQLLEKNRKNALIVPAIFCADGATMRTLQHSAHDQEDKMTLSWLPGLGGAKKDDH